MGSIIFGLEVTELGWSVGFFSLETETSVLNFMVMWSCWNRRVKERSCWFLVVRVWKWLIFGGSERTNQFLGFEVRWLCLLKVWVRVIRKSPEFASTNKKGQTQNDVAPLLHNNCCNSLTFLSYEIHHLPSWLLNVFISKFLHKHLQTGLQTSIHFS